MVTPATLIVIHPEFTQDPNYIQIFIDQAKRRTNLAAWGLRADDSITELACHMIAVSVQAGDAAPAAPSSDDVGDVSTSYATNTSERMNDTELSSTSYGRTYLSMRRMIRPCVVI